MLPLSRNTTYANGSPVLPNDLNDLEDMCISSKHGSLRRAVPMLALTSAWTFNPNVYWASTGGAQLIYIPIWTTAGDYISGFEFSAYGDGAADAAHLLTVTDADMVTVTTLANETDSNRAAAWGTKALTVTPHTMLSGQMLLWAVSSSATGLRIANAHLLFDRR